MNSILLTVILTVLAVHLVNFIIILIVDCSSHDLGWQPMLIMMSFSVSLLWYIFVYPWIRMAEKRRIQKEQERWKKYWKDNNILVN